MMKINDGGPAFPYTDTGVENGMTLRDYFAAQSLSLGGEFFHNIDNALFGQDSVKRCARIAYEIADAMLKERDKQST